MNQVAVVGASGFVGTHLIQKLIQPSAPFPSNNYSVVALTRSKPKDLPGEVQWRSLDLFSAKSTFDALKGIDTAIYLVHSMMPSSRLFQGDFHDTDLLLADNFARACLANGVRHIIYLGGVMPEGYVSPHLQSRHEVEEVFKSTQIPCTILRAGMIVGPGGSSFEILRTLVQKLPVMLLPEWTQRSTQAIFIDDIVDILARSIVDPEFQNQTLDVVNGEQLNYESLLRTMSQVLGRKRWMFPVPIRSTEFSKLWVQIFGNSTAELVSPLIDSLLCDLPQVEPPPLIKNRIQYSTFSKMVEEALRRDIHSERSRPRRKILRDKSVRSIQRLPSVPGHDSQWIAEAYLAWLPRFFRWLIRVEAVRGEKSSTQAETIHFSLSLLPWPLLIIQYVRGNFDEDRQKFHIVGGLLTQTTNTGWLEFRQVCHKKFTLAAIHEFVPSLPWPIYVLTQAPMHKLVMLAFGRHLLIDAKKISAEHSPSSLF